MPALKQALRAYVRRDLPPRFLAARRAGVFGGSFNPAHEGHMQLAKLALARCGLDYVLWLPCWRNPLKPAAEMDFAARLENLRAFVGARGDMGVSGLEGRLAAGRSYDVLHALKGAKKTGALVWLTGGDSLASLTLWHRWRALTQLMAFAVFARPEAAPVWQAKAAAVLRRRAFCPDPRRLAGQKPPALAFITGAVPKQSSTALRTGGAG